jgi:YVTN family beta-propeller protein
VVQPNAIAIAPDGRHVYVADALLAGGNVTTINTATDEVEGAPLAVGGQPLWISITPDGRFAYVSNFRSNDVSVINLATNQVEGNLLAVGNCPSVIAIDPSSNSAYVVNSGSETVSVIDTATNQLAPGSIDLQGEGPRVLAVAPNQPPVAAFSSSVSRIRPAIPLALDASASKDPDGQIASYAWSFGDGQSQSLETPSATHIFANPGTYTVALKETDAEGCSTVRELIFTGQTAMAATATPWLRSPKRSPSPTPGSA